MITIKMIRQQLENLNQEQLERVYGFIETLTDSETRVQKSSLMAKLQTVKIDAPEDFSTQVGLSLGRDVGEK